MRIFFYREWKIGYVVNVVITAGPLRLPSVSHRWGLASAPVWTSSAHLSAFSPSCAAFQANSECQFSAIINSILSSTIHHTWWSPCSWAFPSVQYICHCCGEYCTPPLTNTSMIPWACNRYKLHTHASVLYSIHWYVSAVVYFPVIVVFKSLIYAHKYAILSVMSELIALQTHILGNMNACIRQF